METSPPSGESALRLYDDLASWWHLLSPPEEYEEEARFYWDTLAAASPVPIETLLELGSGGGNNAVYLGEHARLTLVDLSPRMLEQSRTLNAGAEHIVGDMRTVRLERSFDAVFVHDAICYMTSEGDLLEALVTAHRHCRPGGVALFAPDHVRETFGPSTSHGGSDGEGRAIRYLEWTHDPDPSDCIYTVDYAYLLREPDGRSRAEFDRHLEGLFPTATWLDLLARAGFTAQAVHHRLSDQHDDSVVFVGRRTD